jgi:hypothetical protein
MLQKLVSGGQTGVDRAALEVALELGIPCGGWCPRGRKAEDGVIPTRYPLTETETEDYDCRTERNVRDSDGTLILVRGPLQGGTALTAELAGRYSKPLRVVDLTAPPDFDRTSDWFAQYRIHVLNVAGPRESGQPGIYAQAADYLRKLLAAPG